MNREEIPAIIKGYFQTKEGKYMLLQLVDEYILNREDLKLFNKNIERFDEIHSTLTADVTIVESAKKEIKNASNKCLQKINKLKKSLESKEKEINNLFEEAQHIYKFIKVFELDAKKINKLCDIVEASKKLKNIIMQTAKKM